MLERGVKIGAVREPEAIVGQVTVDRMRVLTRGEASRLHYQTAWPPMVPGGNPHSPNQDEMDELTTPEASSPVDLVYLRVSDRAILFLSEHIPQPGEIKPQMREHGPLIDVAPGIRAHLSVIRPDVQGRPTTAWINEADNPLLTISSSQKQGDSPGLHYDRETRNRRLIISIGPGGHDSLFVPDNSVLEFASLYPDGIPGSIPYQRELLRRVAERAQNYKVVRVSMPMGTGAVLPASKVIHDGGPGGTGKCYTAVTYEPEEGWDEEALLANSIFM
jgi:hypothetical protein